jgi:hypothetical protein
MRGIEAEEMGTLARLITAATAFCLPRARLVAALIAFAALVAGWFAADRFRMSTDTEALLSPRLEFRQFERRFDRAFPHAESPVVVVIDAATPEGATLASRRLVEALERRSDLFTRVNDPQDTPFFRQNGLLFLSTPEVKDTTAQMIRAQPFMAPIALDPSGRGVLDGLTPALDGVDAGQVTLIKVAKPIHGLRMALKAGERGEGAAFSWGELISGEPAKHSERRRIVLVDPKLDFSSLQPAQDAVSVIRSTARTWRSIRRTACGCA